MLPRERMQLLGNWTSRLSSCWQPGNRDRKSERTHSETGSRADRPGRRSKPFCPLAGYVGPGLVSTYNITPKGPQFSSPTLPLTQSSTAVATAIQQASDAGGLPPAETACLARLQSTHAGSKSPWQSPRLPPTNASRLEAVSYRDENGQD